MKNLFSFLLVGLMAVGFYELQVALDLLSNTEGVVTASLLATLMQNLRSEYTNSFDRNELRESRWGGLRYFQKDTMDNPIFDPETIANIERSYGNDVVVPVLDAQSVSVGTPYARTCAIVDSENDSALVTLTFNSYGWGFSMTPATHYNNDVKYQEDFNRKMMKYAIEFATVIDQACIDQLETDKNQVDPGGPYAFVGNALQVPQADKNDFYNNVESIMMSMDWMGDVHLVAATGHMPLVRRLDNQGSSNGTNEGFQTQGQGSMFSGMGIRPYNWWPSNRVANGVGVESTAYAVVDGSAFIHNRQDADTAVGYAIQGGGKVWGQEFVPMIEMQMGTFFQEDCGDRSAIGGAATAGNTRSLVQGFEFSTDIVLATAYNSDIAARFQPIQKFEILA